MDFFNWILEPLNYQNIVDANDIIGWILAFIGGYIIYKIVDGFQTRISRHSMILEVESEINEMLSSDFAINICKEKVSFQNMWTILDDFDEWIIAPKDSTEKNLKYYSKIIKDTSKLEIVK